MLLCLLLSAAHPALAAEGFDAHGFHLAGLEADLRAPLLVVRPSRAAQWGFYAGGLVEYASAPLVLVSGGERSPLLDDVVTLDLAAGLSLARFLRIDVGAPVYLASVGEGGAPQGVAMGDVRVAALATLVAPDGAKPVSFGLALRPHLDVPAGDDTTYLGAGGFAGGGVIALSLDAGPVALGVDGGVQVNPAIDLYNLSDPNQLLLGGALGVRFSDHVGATLESRSALAFAANRVPGTASPSELTLSGRYVGDSGLQILLGGAVATGTGAGSAAWRAFAGGAFGTPLKVAARVTDTDGDGLVEPADRCPAEPEVVNGYRDDDGCPDVLTSIAIEARRGTTLARQAVVSVVDETGAERANAQGSVTIDKVVPGSRWRADATGRCTRGEVEFTATAAPSTFVVPMEPHWGSTVRVSAIDEKGAAVPNAEVSWGEEAGPCAPPLTKLVSGNGPVPVGAGSYGIFVTAPGYTTYLTDVVVEEGKTIDVVAKLKPSRVQVTDNEVVILDKVYFETGKAEIKSESFALLDEVARTIQRAQIQRLEVAGHTDDVGDDAANLTLSQSRADAVRTYLVQAGVPAARLVAKGYGESRPLVQGTDATARAKNRRVEFKIMEKAAPKAE